MGQKSRRKRLARTGVQQHSDTAVQAPVFPGQEKPSIKHPRLVRLLACVGIPLLVLAVLEMALRVFGYGYSTRFFEPTGDGTLLTTNQKFAWQFYSAGTATTPTPLLFPREKPAGTFRVFILGESAAAGTPDPAFGFGRQLEVMLREHYPSNRIEVLNVAMRGIDSHMIRQIADECARLSPDLFVVYAGNNEMIGMHAPAPDQFQLSANIRWLRLLHSIRRTKLAQLGQSLVGRLQKGRPQPAQDMAMLRKHRIAFDDPKRKSVYANYAENLRDIFRFAGAAGGRTIVCSVGVNLHDFPPLGSLHRPDLRPEQLKDWEQRLATGVEAETRKEFSLALTHYESAAALDDHFAELHFRVARCHEAIGEFPAAKLHYALARDWDAIPFRTDSRLNSITRSVATNGGLLVRFVDLEDRFAASPLAENGVPGGRIFHEHVHLKFDGDYLVATSLLPEIARTLLLPPPTEPLLPRDECARRLAYTRIDEGNLMGAIARLTGNPPFLDQLEHAARQSAAEAEVQRRMGFVSAEEIDRAVATYRQAIRAWPDDWMLRFNLGNLFNQVGQPQLGTAELAEVVRRLPGDRNIRLAYANSLLQSGQRASAAAQFAVALKVDPNFEPAQQGLRLVSGGR